jgi:hypothetical protein
MSEITPASIHGSWSLLSFDIEKLDKSVAPWGQNSRGLLIFAPSGHMSVSINRDLRQGDSDAQNIFDSILFYSGTFRIEGSVVMNKVQNASNPARIGKDMIRYASLDGDVLTLKTPQESFGTATLRWKRLQ